MEHKGLRRAHHALASRVTVTEVATDAPTVILNMLGTICLLAKITDVHYKCFVFRSISTHLTSGTKLRS